MRKFQGEINGQQFTDPKEFQKVLRQLAIDQFGGNMYVQYSLEDVQDSPVPEKELPEVAEKKIKNYADFERKAQEIEDQLTDGEREQVCNAIDTLKALVENASENIQVAVDSDALERNSVNEFTNILEATMTKIRWTVNRLPADLRFLLCFCLHDATEKMVDNINSELVDRSYEEAKDQANITEERQDIESEVDDIDQEIAGLEKQKEELMNDYKQLDQDYYHSENRIEAIKSASKFYTDLLEAFAY